MSLLQANHQDPPCPVSPDALRAQLHQRLDHAMDACLNDYHHASFLEAEKALAVHLRALGVLLLQLFLLIRHLRLDLASWKQRGFRIGANYAQRTLRTTCGELRYGRAYVIPSSGQKGPGVHPLDSELGLPRDGYSPLVISWFCRLCTRGSFRLASELGKMFLSWAPSASTIEQWVLGLGRPAATWLGSGPLPQGDGEILVIECDGKAIPTATEEELSKRRRPHKARPKGSCTCQRHRGRACRQARGPKKRRQRGHKSKNGRSAALVVMYTLQRDPEGQVHGPINKKVFGSFSSRAKVLQWARQQATRRGFGPQTTKQVQLVVDGESCFEQQLRGLFPHAILTLDLRHAQERLWQIGRLCHREGSKELAAWVEPLNELLCAGEVKRLLDQLEGVVFQGPGSKAKRETRSKAVAYLRKREGLMDYGRWREQDLVLASGIVEGAARHVIGERLDNSGMRWIVERAESLLLLRCIEINGDWEKFFAWSEQQRQKRLQAAEVVRIRSRMPTQLPQRNEESEKRRSRRKETTAATEGEGRQAA